MQHDLDQARAAVRSVEGWMTDDQARRLWDAAGRVPAGGRIVEIGSFRGRSTIVLALAARDDTEIVAIDPHAGNDRGPQEIHGFEEAASEDYEVFHRNLADAGVQDRVRHVRRFSADAHDEVTGAIDLLYIDGAHRFGPARDDVVRWGARVVDGGRLLVHDSFSSVGVTLALLSSVALGDSFEYMGRDGSLVEYRRARLSPARRAVNLLHHLAQLPWFLRNVAVKVAIVSGARPVARLLGHDGETWPY
ncbi:MAG TPA: class I SAM-dependent methyltransferase [Acidimicrobiales bacterium]|nr:class I SAM-dependent methyltransferase [Acidimicrobiales bacterium]